MAKILSIIKYSIVILPPLLLTMWTATFIWIQPGNLRRARGYIGNAGDQEDSDEKLLTAKVRIHSRNVTKSASDVFREYHVPKTGRVRVEKMANCPAEGERLGKSMGVGKDQLIFYHIILYL